MSEIRRIQVIDASAAIGLGTRLGNFVVIEANVSIGEGCTIGHHVVIRAGTRIGNNVRVDDHAVLGKRPMRAAISATTRDEDLPPTVVGDDCIIGTGAVIYAGARLGRGVLVADLSTVREQVDVGEYTIIGRGVAIENRCRVGRYCKLETNAYLCAYSELEDRVFVAPGVVTTNDRFLGRTKERFKFFKGAIFRKGARAGANATLLPGVELAEDCVVGAGSVLTRHTRARKVYLGVPAREHGDVPEPQLLENQDWEP